MKVLFLIIFSLALFAQEKIELLNPNCSEVSRLDSKGKVLENHPIQHQGDLSTCYANTASVMFYTKYLKENPTSDLKQISWLSLAQKNKEKKLDNLTDSKISEDVFSKGGWIGQVYQSIKGQNLCGIPAKEWSSDEFNSSLETNSYTFRKIMDQYQDLFNDKSTIEVIDTNEKYVSPSCFENINHSFDTELKRNLNKARHVESFSVFWKYLQEPKIANLKKFKDYYMTHIFTSTFKKHESNALRFISSDSFLLGPEEVFIDSELNKFISPDKLKKFKSDFYPNASTVANDQQEALASMKDSLKKKFASCIEESLSLTTFDSTATCNDKTSQQTEDVISFISFASQEGIAPSFIKKVLTMESPLRTKQEILSKFMKSSYTNCKYKVPTDWKVKTIGKQAILKNSKEYNKSPFRYSFDMFELLISMDLAGSLSVKTDFLANQNNLVPSDGTHAMAVIGTAKNCSIEGKKNQKCILVQNSYGQSLESIDLKGSSNSNYAQYMTPALKSKNTYNYNNETQIDENYSYGKFWVCDPTAIEKYMTGLGVIQ